MGLGKTDWLRKIACRSPEAIFHLRHGVERLSAYRTRDRTKAFAKVTKAPGDTEQFDDAPFCDSLT